MNEQDIKKALEQLNPSEKQKQLMWGRISNHRYKKSNTIYVFIRNMTTVAAVLVTVLLSGMVINAATGGKILSTIKNVFELEEEETTKKKEDVALPEFEYTGDDMAIKAIVDYYRVSFAKNIHIRNGSQWVPAFVIYEQVEKDDELLVFGMFWQYSYRLEDNVLYSEGGWGQPACFHLEKTDNGYEITNAELSKDGTEYAESIREFTEGYPEVYEMIVNGHTEEAQALQLENRKKYLQMYINDNNLDIRYYKENTWSEEIDIFGE